VRPAYSLDPDQHTKYLLALIYMEELSDDELALQNDSNLEMFDAVRSGDPLQIIAWYEARAAGQNDSS
jgi:hypothetical protein